MRNSRIQYAALAQKKSRVKAELGPSKSMHSPHAVTFVEKNAS